MGINGPLNPDLYNEYTLAWSAIHELSKVILNDTDSIEEKLGPGWVDMTDTLFIASDFYLKANGVAYRIFENAELVKRFAMPYIASGQVSGVLVQTSITVAARASAVASGLFIGYDFVKQYPKVAARFSNFVLPNGITEDVDPEWLENYMDNNNIWVDVRDGLVFGFQDLIGFFANLGEEEREEINNSYNIPADWNEVDNGSSGSLYGATDYFIKVDYQFRDVYLGEYLNGDNLGVSEIYTLEPANYLYSTQPRVGTGNAHLDRTVLTALDKEYSSAAIDGFQKLSNSYRENVRYPIGPLGILYQEYSSGWRIYPLLPSITNATYRKTTTSGGATGKLIYQGSFGDDLTNMNGITSGSQKVGANFLWRGSNNYTYIRLKRRMNFYCKSDVQDRVRSYLKSYISHLEYIFPLNQSNADLNIDYNSLSELQKRWADEYFKYQVIEPNDSLTDSYRYSYMRDAYGNFRQPLFTEGDIIGDSVFGALDGWGTCKRTIYIRANCARYINSQYSFFRFITKTDFIKNTTSFVESIPWESIPSIDPIEPDNIFYYKIVNEEPNPDPPTPEPPGGDDMNNPFIPVVPDNDGDIPFPIIPYFPEIGSSGLVKVYNPTPTEMQAFGEWLWDPVDTALNTILKMFQSPMDGIITLHILYCKPETSTKIPIRVGYLDSNVDALHVINQFKNINMGQVFVPETYGTYLDYSGNTEVELYLPFIGFVQLDANDVMNSAVEIQYTVDCYTGSCVANVKIKKNPPEYGFSVVEYIFMGNCAMQVPITGTHWGQLYSVAISAATAGVTGKLIGAVTHGAKSGAAVGAIGAGGHGLAHSQVQISRSGNLSANYGVMTNRKPYILVRTPIRADAEGFNRVYGYQSNTHKRIKNMFGYLRVKECNIKVSGFADENAEIERFLKSGVLYGKQSS